MTKVSFSMLTKVNSFFTRLARGEISEDKCAKQPRLFSYHSYPFCDLCKYSPLLSILYHDPESCFIFLYVIPLGNSDAEMKDRALSLLMPASMFGIFQGCIPHGMILSPLPGVLSDSLMFQQLKWIHALLRKQSRDSVEIAQKKEQIFFSLKFVGKK